MLYSDRVDISEVIDVNKRSASKECKFCQGLKFNCMSAMGVMIY